MLRVHDRACCLFIIKQEVYIRKTAPEVTIMAWGHRETDTPELKHHFSHRSPT